MEAWDAEGPHPPLGSRIIFAVRSSKQLVYDSNELVETSKQRVEETRRLVAICRVHVHPSPREPILSGETRDNSPVRRPLTTCFPATTARIRAPSGIDSTRRPSG